MAKRMTSSMRLAGAVLAAILLSCATSSSGQSTNQNKSQTVYLPDPTPRKLEPGLLLGEPPPPGTSTPETLQRRNAKRRELVEWAANQLVTLSQRLEADISRPNPIQKPGESSATAAASAARIELLARNLTAALKAQ